MSLSCSLVIALAAQITASGSDVEELVITASRVPTTLERAPVTLDRLDEPTIEARGSPFLTDVLRGVPGLAISESGPPGSLAEIRVRGAEANHTLVVLNGIEVNDPASGSTTDFAQLDPVGVRHVEVLRGPQSALWGSDALAGVIALDVRPPEGSRERTLRGAAGSLDTYELALDVTDATRPFYYGLTASSVESGGANVATVGGEDDGFRRRHLQVDSGYRGADWSVDVLAGTSDASSEFDPTPFPDFVPRDGDSQVDSAPRVYGIAAEAGAGEWHHHARVWRFESDNETFDEHVRSSASSAERTHFEYQLDRTMRLATAEHRLSAAVERETEGFQGEGPITAFGNPNQHQHLSSTSAVLEYAASIGSLDVSLSGRMDENDEFRDAETVRGAVRYAFEATGTTLFLLAGTAVKNPTFTERYGFTPDTFIGNPSLDPEEDRSISLGVQQRIADSASVRAVWFRDRLKDEIDGFAFDAALGGFTAVNREGTSRREGVELSGLVPIGGLGTLRCEYTYLDATEPTEGRRVDEVRRPRDSGGCIADVSVGPRTLVQAGAIYTGQRTDSDFGTFPATIATLDAYWLAHASMRVRVSEWIELVARVDNAFDERYQDVFGYDTAGRRISIGFEARLD
jgi:vitamin B12 transporter